METLAAFRASFSTLLPDCAARSRVAGFELRVCQKTQMSNAWIKQRPSMSRMKLGNRKLDSLIRKRIATRASVQPSDSGYSAAPIAPLQLESPIGQFLSQILTSHPHLVPAAVEQQLEQLQTDREAEKEKEEPLASGTELALYRRIAEIKASERRKVLEEILYALIVQKFMDADVPLIPSMTPLPDTSGRVETWPSKDDKLEQLHSPEAYEMIQNHLALVLGNRMANSGSVTQISKLRVGQVYAASVMYGYFLRRVDQRFQLEKTMKVLPQGIDNKDNSTSTGQATTTEIRPGGDDYFRNTMPQPETPSWSGGAGFGGLPGVKPSRLRTYVMSFDGDTVQRYATIRSKEAISIIEKHTEALFGRPEIVISPQGTIDSSKDEAIQISFAGLRRLVLEAVTFGSFLWDVESYVDSRYHLAPN